MKKSLQNRRRVHVGGSFVLVYEVNEQDKIDNFRLTIDFCFQSSMLIVNPNGLMIRVLFSII